MTLNIVKNRNCHTEQRLNEFRIEYIPFHIYIFNKLLDDGFLRCQRENNIFDKILR